jgi:hypothetical protein
MAQRLIGELVEQLAHLGAVGQAEVLRERGVDRPAEVGAGLLPQM